MASLCQACSSSSAAPLLLAKRVFSLASSPCIFTTGHKIPRHCSNFRAFNSASASASASVCVDLKELRSNELVDLEYAELNLNHKISELHEAIMREDSAEYEEGIILEEYRKGFLLGERLLRPSMVKVSAGPGPEQPREAEGEEATAQGSAEEEASSS